MRFASIVANALGAGIAATLTTSDSSMLMAGDVTVAVEYSSVNYKDALALTRRRPILKRLPLIPGIDLAGTVLESSSPTWRAGDKVILNGWGAGETHHGGYAQIARMPGDWLVRLPAGLTTKAAMALGTAGYTAMLCVLALEHHGVLPGAGEVLVTGASGGVGSVAIALLARLGYRVTASTGRIGESDYLHQLGAHRVIDRAALSAPPAAPLGDERWAGAIDSAGGQTLATLLAQMRYGGCVAACGLAHGLDLPATVAPFIARGVTLAGIDSVRAPAAARAQAWQRLATDMEHGKLELLASMVGLAEVGAMAEKLMTGQVRGRTVVDVNA